MASIPNAIVDYQVDYDITRLLRPETNDLSNRRLTPFIAPHPVRRAFAIKAFMTHQTFGSDLTNVVRGGTVQFLHFHQGRQGLGGA